MRPDCRGAANRPSGPVVAILAMRPFVAKEDHMPDYRPDAPAVDLFTADEQLVLCDWFGVDTRRSERWVRDILDEWNIPEEIYGYPRTSAAVAQILLERIQDRLPQWVGPTEGARPLLDRRSHRKVELWPRHLLTINWADSGPGSPGRSRTTPRMSPASTGPL